MKKINLKTFFSETSNRARETAIPISAESRECRSAEEKATVHHRQRLEG